MKKRLLSMILALSMMLTILPVNAITALAADDMSGDCGLNKGNNVTYVLTQNNEDDANPTYTLTIKGSGNMENYNHNSNYYAPWMWKTVTQVKFEGSVTSIGNYAFLDCPNLTSITIPDSVVSIGAFAFCNCSNLENVVMPNDSNSSLKSIGADAFNQCPKLKSITIPSGVISIGRCAFDVCFNQNPLKVYFPAELPNNIDKELNNYNSYVEYYYPGYKSDLDNEKNKFNDPSEYNWLQSVHYYCDVTIDANGGKLDDGTETKVLKKVWSGEKLTQEQVEAIGVPKKAQKAFFGWKYKPFYITENLENVVIEDGMTFCADYSGNTVTLGQLNNGNELVKDNSYEFTVTINTYCADSGSPIKKLTFGDVAGTIKYKNGKAVGAEGLEVTLPDGGKKNTLTFTFTPNEVGQNKTLTAYLGGLKYKEEEYGPVTSSTTYSVRDRQNAEVTITGLDNTTVKAGEAKEFTVNVTPNDDANTGAKATITVSGANADAVEKIQYKDGETWKDVPGEGLSIDEINNTEFKLITKADANDGDVTITVTAKKADDTEIDKKVAAVTVKKHENAAVTIDDLDGTTVKAGKAQDFTVNVTPNDDTIDKVTFVTTSGEVQWSNDGGNTWTTVPDDVNLSDLTGKQFRVVPAADAANGTVIVTVTAKKADGTEVAKKDASFTVTAREHATVAINNLNGETITQNKPHTFTVTVTAHDDSGNAILTFDNVAGLTYNGTAVTDAGVTVTLTNQPAPLTFTLTPDAEGAGKTLTATLNNGAMDTATYTVSEYEHAKVTIDGLDTDLKQGESKNFTVTVDPKDDRGDATIDFGNKNSEIQYKDGEDWKSMPSDGLKIDLNNGEKPYNFRITPKNDGESQKLTATVKKENTKLGEAEKSYNVSKYVDAVVKIDGLSGTVETDTEKEFTVTVTANDDAGKNVTAKAGFTGPAGATITLKKVQYRFGDSGEWQDGMQELNGMNLDINSLELPFNSLPNITYKLTVTFAEAGNYKFDVSLTKKDAAEAFTSDSAEVTVTKKKEPVTPGGGSTGGGEKPGENPGGGSGNTNPTPKPDEKPDRKIKIDGGIVEVNGKEVKPDEDGNITVKKGDEITVTVDKSKISDAQVFDQWVIKPDSVLNEVDPKSEKISFTMPAEDVTIEAMTRDASIEDDGPGILGTGALIATGVVGSAALLYQGHMLGTELYLRYLLPHGAVIPQNRAELAVLLWQDAENPEPVSTTLYSDISDEDSAIQQAARWAVENDLMEQLDAEEHPDHFDPFVPVTFSDSIRAWKKAQELKKSVH